MIDIENTLSDVCDRVLSGQDLPRVDHLNNIENSKPETNRQKPMIRGSKITLEGLEKGLERLLGPRREHEEGKRMVKRRDVLHARATGLRRFGKVLMGYGDEKATLSSTPQMVFTEDGGAEVHAEPGMAT